MFPLTCYADSTIARLAAALRHGRELSPIKYKAGNGAHMSRLLPARD